MESSHQVERTERNCVHSERSTLPMVRLPATGLAGLVTVAVCHEAHSSCGSWLVIRTQASPRCSRHAATATRAAV